MQTEPVKTRRFKIVHPRVIGNESEAEYIFASPEMPQIVELPVYPGVDPKTGKEIDRNDLDPTLYPLDAKVEAEYLKPHYAPPTAQQMHPHSRPVMAKDVPARLVAPDLPDEPAGKGKRASDKSGPFQG